MPAILLIEDDELFRTTLAEALASQGYAVTQAEDGAEGVKRFQAAPPDLVITDIVMPNQEGIATVRALRQISPKVGIIAMSGGLAKDAPLYLKLAGGLGADRTLQKPFPLTTLLEAVKEVLALSGQERPRRPDPGPATPPPPPPKEGWR
ncbi:MAG: response regulator [Opitutaceae bacterium]|nr:response regulator [Opitutaceae bacterium]